MIEGLRILIVDDEPANVALLEGLLRRWGHKNVLGTSRSAEVLDLCASAEPDLILLDLHMPPPDGLELLGQLRERAGTLSLPVLVLTADVTTATKRAVLDAGARDFLTKPFDADEVRLRVRNLLEVRALQIRQRRHEVELERRVRARTAELEEARAEILMRLARVGDFHDDETGEHTRRVGMTAGRIARCLGWPAEDVERLEAAAPLHDLGKVAVSDTILRKPGRLDAEELVQMRRHTTIGAEMLTGSRSRVLMLAEQIALAHHERWDGGGYPFGLAGSSIPEAGRIVALADVFDALTHDRPYKAAWSVAAAVAEIREQRGRHFDPAVVDAFLAAGPAPRPQPERRREERAPSSRRRPRV